MKTLLEGLALMVMGMGFVICFLVILITGMRIMSKVVAYLNKLFPETTEEVKTTARKISANVDEAVAVALAAITARKNNSIN